VQYISRINPNKKMAKTVAFIDNFDEVEIFLKTFNFYFDEDTICIAGDALTLMELKRRGIQCKALDAYRNKIKYEEAENYSMELARKWFIDSESNDFTEFEGISLGNCLQAKTFFYICYLTKTILDVSNIIRIEDPERVLLLKNNIISTDEYGIYLDCLHKNVFQFLMKDKKCDVMVCGFENYKLPSILKNILRQFRFERKNVFKGNFFYYCPKFLNSFIIRFIITVLDQVKRVLPKNANKLSSVRALTLSASDLTYFGEALIESYLRKGDNYLYYFDDEKNFYCNTRITHVSRRKINSLLRKKKSAYLSNLKLKFEKSIKFEKKKSQWVFENLPLVDFLEKYLSKIIETKIPQLTNFLLHAEYVIKKNNINIVLISERWGEKRIILTQVAKSNGLSVLHIPHGIEAGMKDGDKFVSPIMGNFKRFPFYPTHEISSLKYQQDMQKHSNTNDSHDKMFLTGIPRFGTLKLKRKKDRYDARERLGFSQNEEIVLFAIPALFRPTYDKFNIEAAMSSFEVSSLYRSFVKLFLSRKNSRAVFKLKMSDINDLYINDILSKKGTYNISIFRHHLSDLLTASDAVVNVCSNVAIEALYHDTPVIVYNNRDSLSSSLLCLERVAIEINAPENLIPVLDRLQSDKSFRKERLKIQRNFLIQNLPDDNHTSADRVGDVIFQLAKKH
tara:strand:- start:2486 stop:4516 length:2031 start_codon:yes stop_codon:yes gene_type:complete